MRFHQRQFLPYVDGAPGLTTLSSSSSTRHVLVTTDRAVAALECDGGRYALRRIAADELNREDVVVVASGVLEAPGGRDRAAVAFAERDKLYLHIAPLQPRAPASSPRKPSTPTSATNRREGATRFELSAAPTTMMATKAQSTAGPEVFYGLVLFRPHSMVAFGFVDDAVNSSSPSRQCVRLTNEQFANFFPEFDEFQNQVLCADTLHLSGTNQSYVVFGCAEGFVRVFRGQQLAGFVSGPLKTRDLHLNGPVTSVTLFQQRGLDEPQCSLLVTCAVGRAQVIENVFDRSTHPIDLPGADAFDSIFAGAVADIDLDGELEVLVGTDDQQVLAYKLKMTPVIVDSDARHATSPVATSSNSSKRRNLSTDDEDADIGLPIESIVIPTSNSESREVLGVTAPASPISTGLENNVPPSVPSTNSSPKAAPLEQQTWQPLPKSSWHLEAFGPIYSLLWRDVNRDGVNELLVASATGIYVFEADPDAVLRRLERVLAAVQAQ